jgi:hypothetical protein
MQRSPTHWQTAANSAQQQFDLLTVAAGQQKAAEYLYWIFHGKSPQ